MAWYKNANFLQINQHGNFDVAHPPGKAADDAGIYRCTTCGHEIGIAKTHTLPPQNHHTHTNGAPIRWQLIVAAQN